MLKDIIVVYKPYWKKIQMKQEQEIATQVVRQHYDMDEQQSDQVCNSGKGQ